MVRLEGDCLPVPGSSIRPVASPSHFHQVTRELVLLVRSEGIRLRVFLDDWLILSELAVLCHQLTQRLLQLALQLGFTSN